MIEHIRRVLVTRPRPGADETARRLTAMDLVPVVAPLQAIEPMPLRLPPPDRVAGLVLTSRNAIQSIPPAWFAVPTWAVGDATARHARDHGLTRVVSANGDAATLAASIPLPNAPQSRSGPGRSGHTLLLATGEGLGQPLAIMLRERGFRVIRRIAYRTSAATKLPDHVLTHLSNPDGMGALFFSAEAARVFNRLIRDAGATDATRMQEAFAISEAVAVALRLLPWRAIHVAARPTQDAMLAMLR